MKNYWDKTPYSPGGGGGPGGVLPLGIDIGDILFWNGTAWVANALAPGVGNTLVWNGTTWVPIALPGGVLPPGVEQGDILVWDGVGAWVPNALPPANGDTLVWNGATWAPTVQGAPGGGLPAGTAVGNILEWNGATWVSNALAPANGDTLTFNGTTWVPGGFMTQAAWFVNSATGLDTNDGATAPTALKTLAELQRRFEGKISFLAHTITLSGTFPTEMLALNFTSYGSVSVAGAATLSVAGITTAFTALAAPATDAKLTDTTTPIVWAARVGQRLRLTSGANIGGIATVLKDLGANQARVSQFINPNTGANAPPAVNDTFAVETLDVVIGGVQFHILGTGAIELLDVTITQLANTSSYFNVRGSNNNGCSIRKCRFNTNTFILGTGSSFNFFACSNTATAPMFMGRESVGVIIGHAAFSDITITTPWMLFAATATCFQGCALNVATGAGCDIAATLAFYDRTGANPCIDAQVGASINATATCMGIGNTTTGVGIRARSAGSFVWSSAGVAPTVTGAGGDTSIGGVVTTYAVIAAAPQASIMNANNGAIVGLRA